MNTYEMLIELRAGQLWNQHYACRPHIKTRDRSMLEFYRRIAADEYAGIVPNLEATRKELGGSFQ